MINFILESANTLAPILSLLALLLTIMTVFIEKNHHDDK